MNSNKKIVDRTWAPCVPDDVKEYLQFQATEHPVCEWAEGLCVKYHAVTTVRFVMGSCSTVNECMTDDEVWDDIVEDAGTVSDVRPESVLRWIGLQIDCEDAHADRMCDAAVEADVDDVDAHHKGVIAVTESFVGAMRARLKEVTS